MNLLELPMLFYVVCIVLYVTAGASTVTIALAWAFVVLRVVHSAIHLTYNRVLHRLAVFTASNAALIVLWVIAGTPSRRGDAMIAVREIDHLVLRVVDAEAMLAFYRDVLGCPVERRQDDIGLIQLRAGRSLIDLVPVDGALGRAGGAAPGKEGRNLDHFCLRVEPFDEAAIRRRLTAHGIDAGPLASRYGAEGEGPSLYLDDPEGNVVELKGPADRGRDVG